MSTLIKGDLPLALKDELSSYKELAIDCEMMGLNPIRDRLCVVQIAAEEGPSLVMQIDEKIENTHLKEIMANEAIRKIFHFARMDVAFLHTRLHAKVCNIDCTKLASHIARTYTDRHGLKDLVREFIGGNLDKSFQSSDWGAEKLKTEQLRYAINDVIYLFEIRRCLENILKRENRYELYEKSVAFLPILCELDSLGYQDIFEHSVSL